MDENDLASVVGLLLAAGMFLLVRFACKERKVE